MLMSPHARAKEVVAASRAFMPSAPDEVGGGVAFISAPPLDFVPEPVRGKPVLGIVVTYCGDPAEGERAYAPMLELEPAVAMAGPMPYTAVQKLLEPSAPPGMRNYWSADFLAGLPAEAIETLRDRTSRVPSPMTQVVIVPGGGQVARVPDDATAA